MTKKLSETKTLFPDPPDLIKTLYPHPPDLIKTQICHNWLVGDCRRKAKHCAFAHGEEDRREILQQCKFDAKKPGSCKLGDKCLWKHS